MNKNNNPKDNAKNNTKDKVKSCEKHGSVIFKYKENHKGSWFVCSLCLKEQWRKAQEKRRKTIESQEYHKKYNKLNYSIQKSLSVFLTMILIAANIIKPE